MTNLPNLLTLSRLAVLPVLIGLLFMPQGWAVWSALGVYIAAALSDFLDGYVARKTGSVSALGTFLDPVSDKIFVCALLMTLAGIGSLPGLWLIPALVIVAREFIVSGLREYLGPKNVKVPVSRLAKWKTATQMLALGFLIAGPAVSQSLVAGQLLLSLAALLTVVTGWGYLKAAAPHFRG